MKLLLLITLFLSIAATSHAQQIVIGVGQQTPENQNINRPQRGMSREQVTQYFGEPRTKDEAKGKPPIEKWTYPQFSVYFEQNNVLHSVLHHQPNNEPK